MKWNNIWSNENLVKVLKSGGVVVMPTDTLYGIVGKAKDVSTVERIYTIRKRAPDKPCIILIGDINELENFSIVVSKEQKTAIKKYWFFKSFQNKPEPVSIVFDCLDETFSYLHRGTKTLAFRLPVKIDLQNLLKKTGPLIAPSANTEALPPSFNISKAKKYFGSSVDLYVDGGTIKSKASKVIKLHKDGSVTVLRA
jgi:L-threonylcarbamoyladenylate synthase